MENPEKANMRLAQEYDTAEKHIHQRVNAIHLLAEVFECSTDDVEIMLSLLRAHDVYEIINAVEDLTPEVTRKWSFAAVVIAAKNVTLKQLHDKIDDDLHRKLSTVVVSTKPSMYGTVVAGGKELDENTLMAFSNMVGLGVNISRINAMINMYKAMGEANVRT